MCPRWVDPGQSLDHGKVGLDVQAVSFSERAPETNELAVARLERELSVRFPDDYRSFLLTVNGGRPSPSHLRFEHAGETDIFHVHFFFGVADPEVSCDLKWNAELTRETRDPAILPIASDDYGCRFYLTISGPRSGEVLFGDLPQDGIVRYSRVADSFSGFLEMLAAYPSESE